jgi:Asp-tRNA(Asn)/Glu-tRNA(Gln) amidotransferase A subunit family amidase
MDEKNPEGQRFEGGQGMDRRGFLTRASAAALGVGGGFAAVPFMPAALVASSQVRSAEPSALPSAQPDITVAHAEAAEVLFGIEFSGDARELALSGLRTHRNGYAAMREVEIPPHVAPAVHFSPIPPGGRLPTGVSRFGWSAPSELPDPTDPEALAFATVPELAGLLRRGRVTSRQLTELSLARLERYGSALECVVLLLPERALAQADAADAAFARGEDRGPLQGIPWGAKDLLAVAGFPTSWGAEPFRNQRLEEEATVVRRLDEAGAVLVAKLTLGELAQGDVWFGGRTRNPWNLEQGSSGSSAGSASAVAAGLVPFALGSETLGSIVSPSSRCGVTGLRPTFGTVSRHGAMPLSWSLDKIGPMARGVEACAWVHAVIRGPDGWDATVADVPFDWPDPVEGSPPAGLGGIRIGVLTGRGAFAGETEDAALDRAALRALRDLGVEPREVALPESLPLSALRIILNAEAAASFDDFTLNGGVDELRQQGGGAWPNTFRTARYIPAVEYLRANRLRTVLLSQMDAALAEVDVVLAPSFATNLLLATNLSGHPVVVLPNGFRSNGTPGSISFLGGLWNDAAVLRVARAWQDATGHHRPHPPGFG